MLIRGPTPHPDPPCHRSALFRRVALTPGGLFYIVHMHSISQLESASIPRKKTCPLMPRPRKHRNCRHFHGDRVFKPRSIPMPELDLVSLGEDELEALRLCDLEGLDQEQAGQRMGVSRGTVQRLLKAGRANVVRALVEGGALIIGEGADQENPETRS